MIKFPGTEEFTDTLGRYFGSPSVEKTRTITFQITDDCNLCCSYCYQINKGHHKMPFEVAKKFIDKLLNNNDLIENYMQSIDSPGVILEFIGGEPLLEIDLID